MLEDRAVLIKAKLAPLYQHPDAQLYRQLVDLLTFYSAFPINDHTGDPLTDDEVTAAHYEKVWRWMVAERAGLGAGAGTAGVVGVRR